MTGPTRSNSNNLIRGHLDLILLSILRRGPKYGVQICDEADRRTRGYFDLRGGSVYPALQRLEQAGFIQGQLTRPLTQGKTVKTKVYTLTSKGHLELDARRRAFLVFSKHLASLWDPG